MSMGGCTRALALAASLGRFLIITYVITLTCDRSDEGHEQHWCDARLCPVTCQLCKRLCANQDHFHGLTSGAIHLCGFVPLVASLVVFLLTNNRQEHACTALCQGPGFCEIDTAPQSIEATFTGRHETFQYTKVIKSSYTWIHSTY